METIFTPQLGILLLVLIVGAFAWSHRKGAIPPKPPAQGGGTIDGPGTDDGTVKPPGQGEAAE